MKFTLAGLFSATIAFLSSASYAIVIDNTHSSLTLSENAQITSGARVSTLYSGTYDATMDDGLVHRWYAQNLDLNFSGGSLGRLRADDTSHINITGGSSSSITLDGPNSSLSMSFGRIGLLRINSGLIDISGGTIQTLMGGTGTHLNFYGGSITGLSGFHNGIINLFNGASLDLSNVSPTATIVRASEPPALALMLASALSLFLTTKKKRTT